MRGHHAGNCYFLQKVRVALCYLGNNPKMAQNMKKWQGCNDYKTNKAKVRTLMAEHFIPYSEAPLSVFVDIIDEDHNVFTPDNASPNQG